MIAKIYTPAKNAMQSGMGKSKYWLLEYLPSNTSGSDMKSQLKLKFPTKEKAIEYAQRHGIAYQLIEPNKRKHRPRSYADNFKYGRLGTWTH